MSEAPVLVVDDDPDIREALCELVRALGWQCDGASNGREALDRLRQGRRPAIVLLDLMMPVMDGWQFLNAAEQDPALRDLPIAVVSAVAHLVDPRPLRGRRVLTKPIDMADIAELLATC